MECRKAYWSISLDEHLGSLWFFLLSLLLVSPSYILQPVTASKAGGSQDAAEFSTDTPKSQALMAKNTARPWMQQKPWGGPGARKHLREKLTRSWQSQPSRVRRASFSLLAWAGGRTGGKGEDRRQAPFPWSWEDPSWTCFPRMSGSEKRRTISEKDNISMAASWLWNSLPMGICWALLLLAFPC